MPQARPSDTSAKNHLLRRLNIFGLDHLDAVILAALADERPLLLIGAHGTAKSELLNRLAAALQLEHRHFNASLISFDDLLGYPVPNEARDALSWLRTPGDLWGAESVFLDEISRCRPETQNKLFSVIHERRVQGLPLERLRYRWAAMNPPVADDGGSDDQVDTYVGASPLDPALADRFPWVLTVPRLLDLSAGDRSQVIAHGGQAPVAEAGVADLVDEARGRLSAASASARAWAGAWVEGLLVPLHEMQLDLSGRRAVALASSALAVHAACAALGRSETLAQAAYAALRWGLPQRALGRTIDEAALRAAHRVAVADADTSDSSVWRAIRAEVDPIQRVVMAVAAGVGEDDRGPFSQLVLEALAAQSPAGRHVLALVMTPILTRCDALTAPACEQLAELVSPLLDIANGGKREVEVSRQRAGDWNLVLAAVSRLEKSGEPRLAEMGNLLYALFAIQASGFQPELAITQYRRWTALFAPGIVREAS